MSPRKTSQLMVAFSAWMFIAAAWVLSLAKILHFSHPVGIAQWSHLKNGLNRIDDIDALRRICIAVIDVSKGQQQLSWDYLFLGMGFVLVCSAVFGGVAYKLQRQLKAVEVSRVPVSRSEELVEAGFEGKLEFRKAFWIGYVFLPVMATIVVSGFVALLKRFGVIEKAGTVDMLVTPLALSLITVIYLAGAIVAWRCSSNARPVWKYLARAVIVGLTILPLVKSVTAISYILLRF